MNLSCLMFELGVRPKLRFWPQMSSKQTQKNLTKRNSASELTIPFEMVKKHVRLWNRSILMSDIGVKHKLRCWPKMSMKVTRKIELQQIHLLSSRTLKKWYKKHARLWHHSIMMSEIGVSSKLRCWAKMSMTQTRKTDFNEFNFWAHEPHRNDKKPCQALESLNSDVQDRS